MITILITILVTFWTTCGLIYISKEMARPFSTCRSYLVVLDFIFSPYIIVSDIIQYWKECRELRNRYK